MTSNKKPSLPGSESGSRRRLLYSAVALSSCLVIMAWLARANLEAREVAVCVIYAVVVTVFMGAQLWGFVVSQAYYSESVEAPKFGIIEAEEAEWRR